MSIPATSRNQPQHHPDSDQDVSPCSNCAPVVASLHPSRRHVGSMVLPVLSRLGIALQERLSSTDGAAPHADPQVVSTVLLFTIAALLCVQLVLSQLDKLTSRTAQHPRRSKRERARALIASLSIRRRRPKAVDYSAARASLERRLAQMVGLGMIKSHLAALLDKLEMDQRRSMSAPGGDWLRPATCATCGPWISVDPTLCGSRSRQRSRRSGAACTWSSSATQAQARRRWRSSSHCSLRKWGCCGGGTLSSRARSTFQHSKLQPQTCRSFLSTTLVLTPPDCHLGRYSLLTVNLTILTPHSSLLTPHSSLLTPHPSLLYPA